MANWLNQLQSLLGQSSSSTSSSADQGLGKLLVPGALGGLAGLLVANKSARKPVSYTHLDVYKRQWVDSITEAWAMDNDAPKPYQAGTWGPVASVAMITRDGRSWNEFE